MGVAVTACPTPIFQFFDNAGRPANGGSVLTQVGGVNYPTYQDSTGTTSLPNPIPLNSRGEVSNAAGNSCQLFLAQNQAYTFTLYDNNGNVLNESTYVNGQAVTASQVALLSSTVTNAAVLYSLQLTPAEQSAGVTPTNFSYRPGHLYRFGTNTTPGITDMTTAVNAWASVGGDLTIPVADTILVSGTINLVSNSSITLAEGATIKCATPNISVFKALSKSNIDIRGGTFQQTANGSTVHIGLIELNGCTNCSVERVEMIGAQWAGILLSSSSNCTVRGNYIHNSLGVTVANQDSHDISCYGASSFDIIEANICFGGTAVEHGIMIQDPGSSLLPMKISVYGNRVGPHSSYGILNYLIDHANTYCTIENNEVEGITGTSQSGTSGCGIYNQGAGGTVIANNTVRNCCISTTSNSLTPAGIGLNLDATMAPVTVTGNVIIDIANFYGIEVVNGPANITGNTVRFSAGVAANIGIYLNAASNVNVSGNLVSIDTGITNGQGIFVFANGVSVSNISINNNTVLGTSLRGIRVDTTGAPTTTTLTINGNLVSGGTAASIPLQIANVNAGSITGNTCSATTVQALDVSACINTRYANNVFSSSGTLAVNIAGTCTNSYYDISNTASTFISNAGVGMLSVQSGSAVPPTGNNHRIGDTIEQSLSAVGSPKRWRCTTNGNNSADWTSEGNL